MTTQTPAALTQPPTAARPVAALKPAASVVSASTSGTPASPTALTVPVPAAPNQTVVISPPAKKTPLAPPRTNRKTRTSGTKATGVKASKAGGKRTSKSSAKPAAGKSPKPRKSGKAGARSKTSGKTTARAAPKADWVPVAAELHSAWLNALQAHQLRVESQFRELLTAAQAGRRLKARDQERLQSSLKVSLKPRKGRAKDLRRVEDALDKALSRLGPSS